MNKSDLVTQIACQCDLTAVQAEAVVNLVFDKMGAALASGQRIEIRGFGSFVVKDYESRWGRNPKTGEKIWVEAKHLPAFKLGKELRDRVNRLPNLREKQ